MKLTFYGAAKAVTGSCHCIECGGKKVLIDCGLQQGRDEYDNREFGFRPSEIDAVIVTHAHIDHSGRLPLLVKEGFDGPIYCTGPTAQLMEVMLLDSAHIQEGETKWQNQKGKRSGKPEVTPLYTVEDVPPAVKRFIPCQYNKEYTIFDGITMRMLDAGHLLGSAFVELWLDEGDERRKIVFSGDIGNCNQPILRDPTPIYDADYVVTESTYGTRPHGAETEDYTVELANVIDRTLERGGNVVIPSFAVGRTQELLYFLREMKEQNLVTSYPDFKVYVDSPLAREATEIFSGDLRGYLEDEAMALIKAGTKLFTFPGLSVTATTDESRMLNEDRTPKVIISASGMCEAGRIRHHLKHNLWRRECAIVFVGFQAEGTLGRSILNGAEVVHLFGEDVQVNAEIIRFKGLSSHADKDHLIAWARNFTPAPKHTFAVHGQSDVTEIYAQTLRELAIPAHAPDPGEVYDLLTNRMLVAGVPRAPKAPAEPPASPAFRNLESMLKLMSNVVEHNRGGTNKDLEKFANQLKLLAEKWDR